MARYGGGKESFEEQQRLLSQMAEKLGSIEAKEAQATAAMNDLGAATEKATVRRQTLNAAKKEGADITAREEAVAGQEASALDLNTQAIERNRVARERKAVAVRDEQVNLQRALRGAQDPLFAQASAPGAPTSQYAMRQQYGIGQSRAQALQEAQRASFLRPGDSGANQPFSQAQVAQIGLTRSEGELAQANKSLAALTRNAAGATDEEIAAAHARVAAARAAVTAARTELQSVEQLAAARREAATMLAREAQTAVVSGGGSTALVRTASYGQMRAGDVEGPPLGATRGILAAGQAQAAREAALAEARAAEAMKARVAVAQEEAVALNGLTQGEREYVATLTKEQAAAVAANRELAATAGGQIERRILAETGALQREGATLGSVSQAMYKHGALTQEFVLAAARGEVTLRELGSQALVTAGKFGGWTAAATAVFGVARALGDVAKGAMEAQTAQQNLSRFIPGQTQDQTSSGLVAVSREVNAPIEDVSSTQQVFARVFHNQQDSLTATSTALKAYKLDQIEAAASTRYFTAISQEFQLQANQLPGVFDQISAAQRHMGARVAETLPAIARSSAAVKNAGGDLTQLIALAATAQVSSGQTGNVVGTALSRSAANFSRTPENQKIIESFGINATQSYTQMLIDAVRRSQTLSGAQRTELAKAIGGPQYGGRIFQSLLGQQDRLTNALGIVNPTNAAGSANEELRKKLAGVDEMVKRLGIDLQQLGVVLAQTGAFDFAGLLLKGTDALLHTVTLLIGEFDKIPRPLREGLSVLAEMAVAVKLLQRFAPASLLTTGLGRAIGGPELGLRQRTLRGLRDTSSGLADEADRTQQGAFRAARVSAAEGLRAQAALDEQTAALAASRRGEAGSGARVAAAEEQVIIANRRYEVARLKAAEAAEAATYASLLAKDADETYVAAQGLSTPELKAMDVYRARELGVPSYAGVEGGPAGVTAVAAGGASTAAAVERSRQGAEEVARAQSKLAAAYLPLGAAMSSSSSRSLRAVDRGAQVVVAGADAAASRVASSVASVRAMGTRMTEFAASLGPLDSALAAFIVVPIVASAIDAHYASVRRTTASLERQPKSEREYKDRLALAQRVPYPVVNSQGISEGALAGGVAAGVGATIATGGLDLPFIAAGLIAGASVGNFLPSDAQKRYDAAQKVIKDAAARSAAQRSAEAAGKPAPDRYLDEILSSANRDTQRASKGLESLATLNDQIDVHLNELADSKFIKPHQLPANIRALEALRRSAATARTPNDFASRFGGEASADLRTEQATSFDRLSQPGYRVTSFDLREVSAEYRRLTAQQLNAKGPVAVKQAIDDQTQYFQSLVTVSQRLVQEGDRAGGQRVLDSALAGPQGEMRAAVRRRMDLTHRLKSQEDEVARLSSQISTAGGGPFGASTTLTGALPTPGLGPLLDAARARVNATKMQIAQAIADLRKLGLTVAQARATLNALTRDSGFSNREQERGVNLGLLQSQTSDPATAAAEAVQSAASGLKDATKTYHGKGDQYKAALTNYNNALKAQSDTIKQTADQSQAITFQIEEAQAHGDPVAVARIQQQAAAEAGRIAKTQDERLQATLDGVTATNALQDAVAEITQARFTYLESLTRDPVKQARLEAQAAGAAVGSAHGSAAKMQALAGLHDKQNALIDARLQSREDDIQFGLDMDRISTDTAIREYQSLAKTHGITKDARRQILRQIKQLQDGASGGNEIINPGTIRLPTLYDVRRMARQGTRTGGVTVHNTIRYDIKVARDADIEKLGAHIEKVQGGSLRAAMRSAGLR